MTDSGFFMGFYAKAQVIFGTVFVATELVWIEFNNTKDKTLYWKKIYDKKKQYTRTYHCCIAANVTF